MRELEGVWVFGKDWDRNGSRDFVVCGCSGTDGFLLLFSSLLTDRGADEDA